MWECRKEEVSIFTKVERRLEIYGVTIQCYHGGTLTGVAIIAMQNNHYAIMNNILIVANTAIENCRYDTQSLRPQSITEF